MEPYKYLVRTFCATYNQEQYIQDSLQGFVNQQTTFPVVYLVVDDASTDATPAKIRQFVEAQFDLDNAETAYEKDTDYAHIVYARHKTNTHCYFAVLFFKENQYSQHKTRDPYLTEWTEVSKYLAFCEGDDYWTDPLKLQKQVDFLESHPDYNLVCHNWNIWQNGTLSSSQVSRLYQQPFSFTFETLPWIWITKTLTLMCRRVIDFQENARKYKYVRDVHMVYDALKNSKGYFMPEVMATYRVVDGGVWSKVDANKKNKTTYELYKELYYYEPNKAVRKRYMNATLAYFNGLAYGRKTWWHLFSNAKLYFEALSHLSDAKDLVFCLGGLVPTDLVKWVMKRFKV